MANEFTNFLNKYGLGFRSFEQGMRQGSKRLAEQFKIPYDPLALVEERTVDPEAFQRLRESRMPKPPQYKGSAEPTRRDMDAPTPQRGLFSDSMEGFFPVVQRPDMPEMMANVLDLPLEPDFIPGPRPPRRQEVRPRPFSGMLAPTAPPAVERPTLQTTAEDLLNQLSNYYGEAPQRPDFGMPSKRELGLPSWSTPGYIPEGMMSPKMERPNIQSPAIQNYQPRMFSGQLPMPDMPEFDFGKYRYDYTPDLTEMTDEELNDYYSNILGY